MFASTLMILSPLDGYVSVWGLATTDKLEKKLKEARLSESRLMTSPNQQLFVPIAPLIVARTTLNSHTIIDEFDSGTGNLGRSLTLFDAVSFSPVNPISTN